MARSSTDPLIKNIYTLWGRKSSDQEYIYFMGSETRNSACYILFDELIKNIYTLWGRKRFILPVTYFSTNLVTLLLYE